MIKKLLPLPIASPLVAAGAHAAVKLIAIGTIDGAYEDLATQTAALLEKGVPGNRPSGVGSGPAFAGGNTFLALSDRGPNAKPYNSAVDGTVSYIARLQTFNLSLAPSDVGSVLPFTLTPILRDTTLLSRQARLVYGSSVGLGYRADGFTPLGTGAPALNAVNHPHYSIGRSDNFDPAQLSTNLRNARLEPEVFVSPLTVAASISLDVVNKLTAAGINSYFIPAKMEGIAFGQGVVITGVTKHTLFGASDNDFLTTVADPFKSAGDPSRGAVTNPNKFYVCAFDGSDIPGYVPQKIRELDDDEHCSRRDIIRARRDL